LWVEPERELRTPLDIAQWLTPGEEGRTAAVILSVAATRMRGGAPAYRGGKGAAGSACRDAAGRVRTDEEGGGAGRPIPCMPTREARIRMYLCT